MAPIWATIVRDSTPTSDFHKQTMAAVNNQWDCPRHPNYATTTPPSHERKRARFNTTTTGRGDHTGRGRGRTAGCHNGNPTSHNQQKHDNVKHTNNNWYEKNQMNNIYSEIDDDLNEKNKRMNNTYSEISKMTNAYSESQEDAHYQMMEDLKCLEAMV
jgi:hypothetical protein